MLSVNDRFDEKIFLQNERHSTAIPLNTIKTLTQHNSVTHLPSKVNSVSRRQKINQNQQREISFQVSEKEPGHSSMITLRLGCNAFCECSIILDSFFTRLWFNSDKGLLFEAFTFILGLDFSLEFSCREVTLPALFVTPEAELTGEQVGMTKTPVNNNLMSTKSSVLSMAFDSKPVLIDETVI
jgi:hypothetical protein